MKPSKTLHCPVCRATAITMNPMGFCECTKCPAAFELDVLSAQRKAWQTMHRDRHAKSTRELRRSIIKVLAAPVESVRDWVKRGMEPSFDLLQSAVNDNRVDLLSVLLNVNLIEAHLDDGEIFAELSKARRKEIAQSLRRFALERLAAQIAAGDDRAALLETCCDVPEAVALLEGADLRDAIDVTVVPEVARARRRL